VKVFVFCWIQTDPMVAAPAALIAMFIGAFAVGLANVAASAVLGLLLEGWTRT
jgi:hypothetical protein